MHNMTQFNNSVWEPKFGDSIHIEYNNFIKLYNFLKTSKLIFVHLPSYSTFTTPVLIEGLIQILGIISLH